MTPRLINQFKAGFLYNATIYAYNAAPLYVSQPSVAWNYPGASGLTSGAVFGRLAGTSAGRYALQNNAARASERKYA